LIKHGFEIPIQPGGGNNHRRGVAIDVTVGAVARADGGRAGAGVQEVRRERGREDIGVGAGVDNEEPGAGGDGAGGGQHDPGGGR